MCSHNFEKEIEIINQDAHNNYYNEHMIDKLFHSTEQKLLETHPSHKIQET